MHSGTFHYRIIKESLTQTPTLEVSFIEQHNLTGVVIGLLSFLIIGIFHPIVVKCEYYFGSRCRWWFVVFGIIGIAGSLFVADFFWSTLLAVLSFSSLWSAKEIKEQEERVRKGWFPRNPRRRYPWDNKTE